MPHGVGLSSSSGGSRHVVPLPSAALADECVASPSARPRLPWRPVATLCICNCAHFYTVCSIFSFAGIMTADLGWAPDRDSAGTYAGFLQAANLLGRVPASSFWGFFADRFGHELGLVLSSLSLAIGGLAFGFCTSWDAAVLVRFLFLGAGSGWQTFLGPMSLEVGGPERQVDVTGRVIAAGTFVQLIGPAIGGWTYGWSRRFPALLPSAIGAGLNAIALPAIFLWLPWAKRAAPAKRAEGEGAASCASVLCSWPMPLLVSLRSSQGFANFAFLEVVPLWAISSRGLGGLELNERDLGSILALSAVASGAFMIFGLPRVTSFLGLRRSAALANGVAAMNMGLLPHVTNTAGLAVLHILNSSCVGTLAASYIACINNSVPAEQRATVNGICVSFESLAKGIGPLGASLAFAWTLQHWGFRGHGAVFFFISALHALLCMGTLFLPIEVEGGHARAAGFEKARSSPVAASDPAPHMMGRPAKAGKVHYRPAPAAERPEDASPEDVGTREEERLVLGEAAEDGSPAPDSPTVPLPSGERHAG